MRWILQAGRGSGKSRTGSETVRRWVTDGVYSRINLVGKTAAAVRDEMIEGPAGILSVCPNDERPEYVPTRRRLNWPNGAVSLLYSAQEPDTLRGPQCEAAWGDEIASWAYVASLDNLLFGMRLGAKPRLVATTTPRKRRIMDRLLSGRRTVVTTGSTYENADNLAEDYLSDVIAPYEGTRLGRQEIYGEILEDVEGALWNWDTIEAMRLPEFSDFQSRWDLRETLPRVVIALDPTSGRGKGDDYGLIAGGSYLGGKQAVVLEDASGRGPAEQWCVAMVELYDRWQASAILVEKAFAQMEHVRLTLKACGFEDRRLPIKAVPARVGKYLRAEPVAALCARAAPGGLVDPDGVPMPDPAVLLAGSFPLLEGQLTQWVPPERATADEPASDFSPGRLDAFVYMATELILTGSGPRKTPAGYAEGKF